MSLQEVGHDVPRWIPGSIIVLFVVSLVYGVVVLRRPLQILSVWFGLLGIGVVLLVVYLLYRILLAVEQ